jgi:hypothetical protein
MTTDIDLSSVRPLRDGRTVGAGIACGKVDVAAAIPDNSRALTDGEGERLEQPDLVATLRESGADVGRDGLLHLYIATLEGLLGEARLLERSLDVHSVVNNVGDKLRVRLSLVPASHDAEADVHIALLHEGRNDGVKRALVSFKRVGQARRELKAGAAILEREAESWGDEPGAIAGVVALNERDDVPVLVNGGEIDGGVAMFVKFRRDIGGNDLAGSLVHVNELCTSLGEVLRDQLLDGTGVKRGSPTYLYMSA